MTWHVQVDCPSKFRLGLSANRAHTTEISLEGLNRRDPLSSGNFETIVTQRPIYQPTITQRQIQDVSATDIMSTISITLSTR